LFKYLTDAVVRYINYRSYLGTVLLEKPDRSRGIKTERILRVLLNEPDGDYTRYRIAKEAEVSESWCRTLLDRYEDEGYIDGTEVKDARALFDEWLEARVEPKRVDVAFQNPLETIRDSGSKYALTTSYAENIVQGLLFQTTAGLYIHPEEAEEWTELIRDEGLFGGGNTRLWIADEHVFYGTREIDGWTVVSPAQLIVDLLGEDGPAVQAADDLIKQRYE
jgi:hypothetical protein